MVTYCHGELVEPWQEKELDSAVGGPSAPGQARGRHIPEWAWSNYMIKSMTGYGRAELTMENRVLTAEIKSLNHRYLEIIVRMPGSLFPLELDVKRKISDRITRGRVEVNIRIDSEEFQAAGNVLKWNLPLIKQYRDLLVQLKKEIGLKDRITLPMLIGIKDAILASEEYPDIGSIREKLDQVLDEAIDSLMLMRVREGEIIYKDLVSRVSIMIGHMEAIRKRAPEVVNEYRKKFAERVKELTGGMAMDEARLSQEVAIMAERSDITEEIIRFCSHVDQLNALLASGEPVGRKIDFLLQEMNREVNTIGSKSSDSEISYKVVEIKTELSRLREQVQNIE
ncbi:MAG: YicC/YloC family endoribonuclease [Syntrophales bacterium]